MSIENQDRIAQRTQNFAIVKSLREQKNEFMAQMQIIENAIKDGESNAAKITPSEVINAREALCRLKINGQALTNVLDWGKQNQIQQSKRETRIMGGYVSGGWSNAKKYMCKKFRIRQPTQTPRPYYPSTQTLPRLHSRTPTPLPNHMAVV
jgi:hypothetical protein